jgi:hypothetical protein
MARRSAMDEIRRRKAAQAPFHARLRPPAPRAAVDDFDVGCLLLGLRHQRPVPPKAGAGAGLGDAAMMPPAIAALAALPRLRLLTEQRADRRKGRFALRAFLFRRQPFWGVGTFVRFFRTCCGHRLFLLQQSISYFVTTGLDPVVHADMRQTERARLPHGLPDQVRQ